MLWEGGGRGAGGGEKRIDFFAISKSHWNRFRLNPKTSLGPSASPRSRKAASYRPTGSLQRELQAGENKELSRENYFNEALFMLSLA